MKISVLWIFAALLFLAGVTASIILMRSKNTKRKLAGKIIATVVSAAAMAVFTFFAIVIVGFATIGHLNNTNMCITAVLGITLELIIAFSIWKLWRIKWAKIAVLSLLGAVVLAFPAVRLYDYYQNNVLTMKEENVYDYNPAQKNSKAVSLGEPSALVFDENDDLPRMNGATALYPIYASFAKAAYPESVWRDTQYLDYGGSDYVYELLIDGSYDIAFAAYPSEEQLKTAKDSGVELNFTPIGKEAFVFFVNKANKLDDITIDQIKGIYSGKITDWSELGVKGGAIKAFQRNKNSGSQSALERLMDGTPIMKAPAEDYVDMMAGIISRVADYKNYRNSIGYSFRFYAASMFRNNRIKLLSVNGVYPDEENIRSGAYPIADEFYAVTRADASENTKKLVEWALSEQGQEIIEKIGYTPIRE